MTKKRTHVAEQQQDRRHHLPGGQLRQSGLDLGGKTLATEDQVRPPGQGPHRLAQRALQDLSQSRRASGGHTAPERQARGHPPRMGQRSHRRFREWDMGQRIVRASSGVPHC